jgi:hypothetical protein
VAELISSAITSLDGDVADEDARRWLRLSS